MSVYRCVINAMPLVTQGACDRVMSIIPVVENSAPVEVISNVKEMFNVTHIPLAHKNHMINNEIVFNYGCRVEIRH